MLLHWHPLSVLVREFTIGLHRAGGGLRRDRDTAREENI